MRLLFILLMLLTSAHAESFAEESSFSVCYTPHGNCAAFMINAINNAKNSINVEAYEFTSLPIATSLIKATERGVQVLVILDKQQIDNKRSMLAYLLAQDIPIYIDYKPTIAHNKIMIIDEHIVMTGSYNLTAAAQLRNAENILLINDTNVAASYTKNWDERLKQSVLFTKL